MAAISLILLMACPVAAQEGPSSPVSGSGGILDIPGRIFDLEIPEGFKQARVEEPGVMKWTRAGGQIHLVVGNLHVDSADSLFNALKRSVEKNDKLEKIRVIDFKNGKGLMFRNQPPEDKQRLRFWRLFAITDDKAFTLECSSSQSEFDKYAQEFENTLNSFKIKTEE
jgi:hypothetical protein